MNKYSFLLIIGMIFWVAESAYFGWNMEPINAYEATADTLATIIIIWGVVGDILKGVTWQKSTHITVAKEDLSDTIHEITK